MGCGFSYVFYYRKGQGELSAFLKLLLKGQSYAELAYMTGVLPIAKYSDGSELNMFLEYNMATRIRFSEYFGFTDEEVDVLYQRYLKKTKKTHITRESFKGMVRRISYSSRGEIIQSPLCCVRTDGQPDF